MAIEGVVFDVSGTLLETTGGYWSTSTETAQPEIEPMLAELKLMDLQIVAASNSPVFMKLRAAGLEKYIDHLLEKSDVGIAKGSAAWVAAFRSATGLEPHQLLYVGDTTHDMVTATRGPMIYAHAMWSCPPSQYGLRATSPRWVVNVVKHIFRKQTPWYWTLETTDTTGRRVQAMTLVDGNGAGSQETKERLVDLFKRDRDVGLSNTPMNLSEFVMLHMLASVYDSNLFGGADYWTTYPGHTGAPNSIMGNFVDIAAKLSRNKHSPSLLQRHTPAKKSRDARGTGDWTGALRNQIDTIRVGDEYREKLIGKRILLLDNFLTWGFSMECARNMLLNAGAAEVVVACIGKYGQRVRVIASPTSEWDAFAIDRPDAETFLQDQRLGDVHTEALGEFQQSLSGLTQATW